MEMTIITCDSSIAVISGDTWTVARVLGRLALWAVFESQVVFRLSVVFL